MEDIRQLVCLCNAIDEDQVNAALELGIPVSEIHAHYGRQVVCGMCLDKMHLMMRKKKQEASTSQSSLRVNAG